jgi:hypothetical protein
VRFPSLSDLQCVGNVFGVGGGESQDLFIFGETRVDPVDIVSETVFKQFVCFIQNKQPEKNSF